MGGEAPTRDGTDAMLGAVLLERYRIEEPIGEGGIGRVYRARHLTLGNHVAVKVLLDEYQERAVLRKRFAREAAALSELSHPNIVKIADFGLHGDVPFLVMELLEGEDLAARIARAPIAPADALSLIRQILRGLAYAHRREVIHRDVKPHNVFVRELVDGALHAQVLDFGLARFAPDATRTGAPLTKQGAVLGTPAYMAPEQATGERVDATADVYSVGVVLYELLCGLRPFTSRDSTELLRAHLLEEPPDPSEVDPGLVLSAELRAVLDRALAKTREERFADAGAMYAAIEALGPDAATRTAPRGAPSDWPSGPTEPTLDDTGDLAFARTSAATPGAKAPRDELPGGDLPRGDLPPDEPLREEPPDGRPSAASAPKRASRGLAVVGLGALLLCCAAATGLGVALSSGGAEPSPSAATSRAEPTPVVPPEPPPPPPGVEPPPVPSDPLAGPLPEPLASLQAKVASGRTLSPAERTTLDRYAQAHPADARARLILAHHFVDERSLSWALPQYERAIAADPTVTRDPEMLPDLLEMVRSRSAHRRAVELVVQAYGPRALPAAREERASRRSREERQRLDRLIARLDE